MNAHWAQSFSLADLVTYIHGRFSSIMKANKMTSFFFILYEYHNIQ